MYDSIELERVRIILRQLAHAASDTHETGFAKDQYKRQLIEMKWFLDDIVHSIGYFPSKEQCEQERSVQLLKRKEQV